MKQILITILISLVVTGCCVMDNMSGSVESMLPDEVNARIESLREFIIPPKGVSEADVDAVFGVSEEYNGSLFNKITPDTLMRKYQLLDPEPNQDFRSYLYVKYTDDKVEYIGISHSCSIANLIGYSEGSPEQIEQQQMLDRNKVFILKDLIEIKEKYGDKLKDASWNK